ncbi:hypothetical protein ACJX0J_025559, partial [Zea mays]
VIKVNQDQEGHGFWIFFDQRDPVFDFINLCVHTWLLHSIDHIDVMARRDQPSRKEDAKESSSSSVKIYALDSIKYVSVSSGNNNMIEKGGKLILVDVIYYIACPFPGCYFYFLLHRRAFQMHVFVVLMHVIS